MTDVESRPVDLHKHTSAALLGSYLRTSQRICSLTSFQHTWLIYGCRSYWGAAGHSGGIQSDSSFDELWQRGVDAVTPGSGRAAERQLDAEGTCCEQDTVGYRKVRTSLFHPGLKSWKCRSEANKIFMTLWRLYTHRQDTEPQTAPDCKRAT